MTRRQPAGLAEVSGSTARRRRSSLGRKLASPRTSWAAWWRWTACATSLRAIRPA